MQGKYEAQPNKKKLRRYRLNELLKTVDAAVDELEQCGVFIKIDKVQFKKEIWEKYYEGSGG